MTALRIFDRKALTAAAALALLLGALPALAQYKVVGPDGRVTYTDRPSTEQGAQVQALRRDGAKAGPSEANALPAELRPVVARFPVTLFTTADCTPCDAARKLLQIRGVPFTERTASSDDDSAALQRLTGGRAVPALTVGAQALRGLQESDWQNTLDLAGYPRESKLPRGYQAAAAAPLVARAAPAVLAAPPRQVEPAAPVAAPTASGGIRF